MSMFNYIYIILFIFLVIIWVYDFIKSRID